MVLEFSQYLENYLWPNYNTNASHSHMMSIVVMLNEKFRERVQAWEPFKRNSKYFSDFFRQVLHSCLKDDLSITLKEQTALLVFLNHCFNSMEVVICRDQVKRLVSLSMWISLQEARRDHEFKLYPMWKKNWKKIHKKDNSNEIEQLLWERTFLHKLMLKFMTVLDTIPKEGSIPEEKVKNLNTRHVCFVFKIVIAFLDSLL